jgi:hypothetical protein
MIDGECRFGGTKNAKQLTTNSAISSWQTNKITVK